MMLLFPIIGASFMSAGVVVVLTMGRTTAVDIIVAAAIGFGLVIPASRMSAKKLQKFKFQNLHVTPRRICGRPWA